MPRFSLREFSVPNYRDSLPASDPNNAIWPRISMLAKMLNEIPWFKKGDGDDSEPKSPESVSASQEENDRLGQENAQRDDDPEGLTLRERGETESEKMKGYTPDDEQDDRLHVEDLDRDELGFDLQNADRAAIKQLQQQLREGGYDIKADGVWGPKTQAAYDDYNRKLMGSKLYNQNYGDVVGQPENKPFESALDEAEREYGLVKSDRPAPRSLPKGVDEAVEASGDPTHYDDEFTQYFHNGVPDSGYKEMLAKKYNLGG